MLGIPGKMMAGPCKMIFAPRVMLAATHFMFAKDQRGGLEEPLRAPGDPPLSLYLKKLFCLEMIFRTLVTKKNKK